MGIKSKRPIFKTSDGRPERYLFAEPKFETWLLSFPTHQKSLKFRNWCVIRAKMTFLVYPGIEFISIISKEVILPVPVDHSINVRRFYRG